MTEDFLHYLWKFQSFQLHDLVCTSGKELSVIKIGQHNSNSGPDFLEAELYIQKQFWAGNVEIHVKSSDWFKHAHHHDPAFQSVILHVVYEHDQDVILEGGERLPVLELKGRFDEYAYWRFEQLVQNPHTIPCSANLRSVDSVIISKMMERVLCERLELKQELILSIWRANQSDWVKTCFQLLGYGQGLKVNSENMYKLTRIVRYESLVRESNDRHAMEALLLGTSGLLVGRDDYSRSLLDVYNFLNKKYRMETMDASLWKYSRLRPSSFPDRRIVQLAYILHESPDLPRLILSVSDITEVQKYLGCNLNSEYWQQHYRLGSKVKSRKIKLTLNPSWIEKLIINVIIPLKFTYAKIRDNKSEIDTCLDWLEQLRPEDNHICRLMKDLGFELTSAGQTQAAIHLFREYCSPKKCLNCAIGIKILRSE